MEAEQIFLKYHPKDAYFERAIFASWYCGIGDCAFCYMSTQKKLIKDKTKAKRRLASVLAEIAICKMMDWKIEFISAGYDGISHDDCLDILKNGSIIYGEKLWLNIGTVNEKNLKEYLPYIKGVSASIETVNEEIHKKVCPSKPIKPYIDMFKLIDKYNLKKSITIIVGLGETIDDIKKTVDFVNDFGIDRITVYALRPVKGTKYFKAPDFDYYLKWITSLRLNLPKTEIIAGLYSNDPKSAKEILKVANGITKFPLIKKLGVKFGCPKSRNFVGKFSKLKLYNPDKYIKDLDGDLKLKVLTKLKVYEKYFL